MKKLFALVLTLALVFAIAAPAMAAGMGFDAPAAPAPASGAIGITVTQLQPAVATAMAGYYVAATGEYYALYNQNIGVVGGVPVRFAIDVTIPGTNNIQNYAAADYTNLVLDIAVTNITTVAANVMFTTQTGTGAVSTPAAATAGTTASTFTVAIPALDDADVTRVRVMATGVVTADGTNATATAGISNPQSGTVTFARGGNTYTAAEVTGTVEVTKSTGAEVVFTRGGTGAGDTAANSKIVGMTVTDGSLAAADVGIDNGVATFKIGDALVPAANVPAYQAALNDIFAALGFTWSTNFQLGYFSDANINSLAASVAADKTVTWKAFTAALTVTDGTSVPNTGDNMSVIGFVMVGLALLATAAVIVKKVRA